MTTPVSCFSDLGVWANQTMFILCAILGGIAHYLKKVAKKETTATWKEWWGNENWAASIYTILVFFFIIIGALAGDIINSQTGFWASLYTGFATGFAVDAGFNSGNRNLTGQLRDIKAETGALFIKTNGLAARSGVQSVYSRYDEDTADYSDEDVPGRQIENVAQASEAEAPKFKLKRVAI